MKPKTITNQGSTRSIHPSLLPPEDKVASAVRAIVAPWADDDFADVGDGPSRLDLPIRKGRALHGNQPRAHRVASAAVLAVVGPEPDDYQDFNDHPGSLDLRMRA